MNMKLAKNTSLLIMAVICLQLAGPTLPVYADNGTTTTPPADTTDDEGSPTAPVTPSSVKVFDYLTAPGQAKTTTIGAYIVRFVNFLALLIGSFGILAVIVGGYFLLTAGGREEAITRGKDIIKFAIIGIIVAVSAFWLVAAVQSLFY